MASRQHRPEGVALPLVDLFLPPDLAEGAAAAFNDYVQSRKAFGMPTQFVNGQALLWSAKIILGYEAGRFVDAICSLRRDQLTIGYTELSVVVRLGKNYMLLRNFSAISSLLLFVFGVTSWIMVYLTNLTTYERFIPTFINIILALLISSVPFYSHIAHTSAMKYLRKMTLTCFVAAQFLGGQVSEAPFILYLLSAKTLSSLGLDAGLEVHQHVSLDICLSKVLICAVLITVVTIIVRLYISVSLRFRSPAHARLIQNVLNKQSGKDGWYIPHTGDKYNRNLLKATKRD